MDESNEIPGPRSHVDQPQEQDTVRTTIVGGRPPGTGQPLGAIPRGVEVLVKKASVDPEFREVLLAERAEAAKRIGLTLDPAEASMLSAVSREQLETIIAQTDVPKEHRRVFMGMAAAAMLAAMGVYTASLMLRTTGIAPDDPTLDENGRPKRNAMGEEGGAAPSEPPSAPNDDSEDSGEVPPPSPDMRPGSFGIRPGMKPE